MIKLENITKSYTVGTTTLPILKGINFTVATGELVAIMGPSGCGKTTTMNILGLLDQPTSGSYSINDTEVSTFDSNKLAELRNQLIGFVFQSFFLLPRFSALQNVSLPLIYRGVDPAEIQTRTIAAMKKVGVEELAKHKPYEMSGGQQQRVAIARALIGNPSIILADEPTGALDSKTGEEVMNLLIKLSEEEQATIVVVTHDAHIAARCSRTIQMKDGIIINAPEGN